MKEPSEESAFNEGRFEGFTKNVEEYIRLEVELTRLRAVEKAASTAGNVFALYLVSMVALTCAILGGAAVALYLSALTGSYVKGFTIVSLFYILVLFILVIFRKKLLSDPARDRIISDILSDKSQKNGNS
jgi:hypothetical protein